MRKILGALVATFAVVIGSLSLSAPAHADGDQCVPSNGGTITCLALYGGGKYVQKTATGSVSAVNQWFTFCNTQAHNWYSSSVYISKWSGVDGRCVVAPRIEIGWYTTVPYNGTVYSEMYSGGSSLYGYPGVWVWG